MLFSHFSTSLGLSAYCRVKLRVSCVLALLVTSPCSCLSSNANAAFIIHHLYASLLKLGKQRAIHRYRTVKHKRNDTCSAPS
ncbi:hypothetical protein EJ04DRAFT_46933 [Polyplosphaeria fusca]|uniref:Uncharacterized protein n=1 Tax=Polyplosphaeria fusca TaxID=682080 RepID=A0A9P4UXH9_9PLEO|nr:hypothetical protein EJ04DRAFT_46933 [Polyplosphaeria fusca]